MIKLLKTLASGRRLQILVFPIVVIAVFAMFAAFNIHNSSIGEYYKIFNGRQAHDPDLLFGTPRTIRSDEWMVTANLLKAISINSFGHVNPTVGPYGELTTISGWRLFFYPSLYGLIMGRYNFGYTFGLNFGLASCLIAVYLLCFNLFKKISIAVLCAIAVSFSPFLVWWSGHYYITVAAMFFLLLQALLSSRKWLNIIVIGVFLTFVFTQTVFIFYPPFTIACFLVFAVLTGFWLFSNLKSSELYVNLLTKILSLMIFVVAIGAITYALYLANQTYYSLTAQSVYPGARIVHGGNFGFGRFFSGYFSPQLLLGRFYPPNWLGGNQSEAASFYLFFPVIITAIWAGWWRSGIAHIKKNLDVILLCGVCIFLFLRMVVDVWSITNYIPLLKLIPHARLTLAVGLASYFATFIYCFKNVNENKVFGAIFALIFGLFVFGLGQYIVRVNGIFVPNTYFAILYAVVIAGLSFLLLCYKKYFLVAFALLNLISTVTVHPIYKGFNVLQNSPQAKFAQSLGTNNLTVVYNSFNLSSFLRGQGVKTLSGVYFYPQKEIWQKFDASGKYQNVYNRFAHVTFANAPHGTEPVLKLKADDAFEVIVNPCSQIFASFKVKYIISIKQMREPCLKDYKTVLPGGPGGITIYSYTYN